MCVVSLLVEQVDIETCTQVNDGIRSKGTYLNDSVFQLRKKFPIYV